MAFSFPIKPSFSTVLPFKFIRSFFNIISLETELIIRSLYFDTFGCSQIKFISKLFIKKFYLKRLSTTGFNILGDLIFLYFFVFGKKDPISLFLIAPKIESIIECKITSPSECPFNPE